VLRVRTLLAGLVSAGLSACCLTPVGPTDAGVDAGLGPAACLGAGGQCVIGPPSNCPGTILTAYDCNPPPRNPAGSVCCRASSDAGSDGGPLCTIRGYEYAAGVLSPENYCQSCQPSVDPNGWTTLADGTSCASHGPPAICYSGVCQRACLIDRVL